MEIFVYTLVPGKTNSLLAKIIEVGVPKKVTQQWLQSIGYYSSNDRTSLPVLNYIGFTNASSVPTDKWKVYRGTGPGKVLAHAIQESYSELYDTYPDAHAKGAQDIEAIIKSKTTVGQDLVSRMTTTFKNLCAEADFLGIDEHSIKTKPQFADPHLKEKDIDKGNPQFPLPGFPSLHIDIQVHVSPETSLEQIDKIFDSIAKHLHPSKT